MRSVAVLLAVCLGLLPASLLVMAGCATTNPVLPRMAIFKEMEYAAYDSVGTASISGQAFAKTKGGDVKYAAGNVVGLNPVTTYSTEMWERYVIGGQALAEADPRAQARHRQVTADGEGHFSFKNLPAGEYYIACGFSWQYPGGYGGALITSAVVVGKKVRVGPGEHIDVVLERLR